ncbi:hypothetical protein [Hydrogenophaga laconesensis]|uniref:Uncharacterized protein n=1 Tax=Hydrogenophaga laconesensis TaxID=1805971 RepID=A0ABU1VDV1_9BURK|nr:hypothetical protein [Hydrogenophaga laconesensis]MDR7095651.1 hypothetical protein [Hydrogenophaga laconesensis]
MKKAVLGRSVLLAVVLAWSAPLVAQTTTPLAKMDIAGVRIGMTEAEVVKAIQAFDPGAKMTSRSVAYFPYFDGVNDLKTPEFLDQMGFRTADAGIGVWFAGPPSEPRVLAVVRRVGPTQPPSAEQMLSALTAKHGPFNVRSVPRPGGGAVVHWDEEGKAQCTVVKERSGQRVPSTNAMGTLLPPNAVKVLEQYARQDVFREALGASRDVSKCGTVLRYEWGSEPVRSFEAWLVDQGGMVTANRRSVQWVEQLKAEAVRKLQSQGKTPKL